MSSSDTSSEQILVPTLRHRRVLRSSDDESLSQNERVDTNTTGDQEWFDPQGNQPNIRAFRSECGVDISNVTFQNCCNVGDFYALLVTDEMLQEISDQTNTYAVQKQSISTSRRINKWVPTNKNEIKRLFWLIIWMGLVKYPAIYLYWSRDPQYYHPFPHKIMSRNRFEILLRMLHFCNNETADTTNRLYKIQPIIDDLNTNFKKYYHPTELICIDESMIPFRGRISFRQYMKQKKHKYGIKIFKLSCGLGYTYNFSVYSGKMFDEVNTTSTNIVMNLCENIFHKGHTLCTDNWYTSVNLAKQLIQKNTHLIGTLRSNRKDNPKEVVFKKLKRGECVAQESKEGITVLKWREKRDVLLLSTKHTLEMKTVRTKSKIVAKPTIVIDYNEGKKSIDLSDQIAAYSNPLRKSMKWYRKLGFELLLNTAVVNSFFIHQETTGQKMSITMFRKKLIDTLVQEKEEEQVDTRVNPQHHLKKKEGSAHKIRKYCTECYQYNARMLGPKTAKNVTPKVTTFCNECTRKPHLCLSCFNKLH